MKFNVQPPTSVAISTPGWIVSPAAEAGWALPPTANRAAAATAATARRRTRALDILLLFPRRLRGERRSGGDLALGLDVPRQPRGGEHRQAAGEQGEPEGDGDTAAGR